MIKEITEILKRLEIIKNNIELADYELIVLQISKLKNINKLNTGFLSNELTHKTSLEKIINLLEANNYQLAKEEIDKFIKQYKRIERNILTVEDEEISKLKINKQIKINNEKLDRKSFLGSIASGVRDTVSSFANAASIVNNELEKMYLESRLEHLESLNKLLTGFDNIEKKDIKYKVVENIDTELQGLKLELKSLESKFQELIIEKTEYLNSIDEFNAQYNLHLGELIKSILNLKKEILYKKTIKQQKAKEKYQEDIKTFEETQETIDELKETIAELKQALENIDEDDENYDEIVNTYKELQEELDKLEGELKTQEEELEKTKEFIEDEEIEKEYEDVKSSYEEFESDYENIKDEYESKIAITDEEKIELKKLYKKVARLCHPDIVPDELKEKAHELMQKLNEAYSRQDIKEVKKILKALETGSGFELSSDSINDKELLKAKIQEYKENIFNLQSDIQNIEQDETYQLIINLDNWDEYFEELKSDLESEKERLEKEASEVLEEHNILNTQEKSKSEIKDNFRSNKFGGLLIDIKNIDKVIQIKNKLYLQTYYSGRLEFDIYDSESEAKEDMYIYNGIIKNPDCAVVLIRDNGYLSGYPKYSDEYRELQLGFNIQTEKNESETNDADSKKNNENNNQNAKDLKATIDQEQSAYSTHIQSIENVKFKKIRKYCENLTKENQADELQEYLGNNGKMHKALIYDTLEQFIENLNGETVTLVDWGCGQGIGSMLVLDYIKEKQLDIIVNLVILIDNDAKVISRAVVHLDALRQNDIEIITISSDDSSEREKLQNIKNNTILNIIVNDKFPIDILNINYELLNQAYFMCVSSSDKIFVDEVYEAISTFKDVQNFSIRDNKIGRFEKFERIFKVENNENSNDSFIGDIKNCNFDYKCPLLWENLKATDDNDIKYCDVCKENVYRVYSEEEFKSMLKNKRCVLIEHSNTETMGYPVYQFSEPLLDENGDEIPY